MFTLLLRAVIGCSPAPSTPTPEPAPHTITITPTKSPEPWDTPGWFPRTVAESVMIRDHIASQLDTIVIEVEKTDPDLATDLRIKVSGFRSLTPSMVVDETPDHNAIFAKDDGCKQEPCERFVSEDMAPVALWNPSSSGILGVNCHAVNSVYAPFIVFHELYHRADPTAIAIQDSDRIPGVPNHWETDAWNFQSRVMDAATGGEYRALIRSWASAVQNGIVPSVIVEQTVNAPVPSNFATLFNRGVGNSDLALQGLAFMFEYDLNRELITGSGLTETEQGEALALLYNRINAAPRNSPEAATLVRESMRFWRREQ